MPSQAFLRKNVQITYTFDAKKAEIVLWSEVDDLEERLHVPVGVR